MRERVVSRTFRRMGIVYRADRSVGCTTSVWDGSIGPEDVQQHLIRLAEDREWPPGRLHLTDLTTIQDATIPDPELLDLLYEGTNLSEELKVAVVVRSEFLRRPDLRFASAAHEISATTFTDLDLACAYLGIDAAGARATIKDLREELGLRRA
jgi:hypothetical protein